MRETAISTIKKHNMLKEGDKVVVGVSGGADSVALLLLLNELREEMKLTLFVVHVNHGIRGEDAKRDELFVENICKKLGISYEIEKVDIINIAKNFSLTEEEAGRKARYDAFYRILREKNTTKIAVAHNLNDQAETVLMYLCRGSGLTGLKGILPVRDEIIRPLIECSRSEIEKWLKIENQEYCIDYTNFETEYTRNKIRNNLLPYIEEQINSNAVKNIARNAALIKEEDDYIEKEANKAYYSVFVKKDDKNIYLDILKMKNLPKVMQRRIIRIGFKELNKNIKNLTLKHVNASLELMNGATGKRLQLGENMGIIKEYKYLKFTKIVNIDSEDYGYAINEEETVYVKEAGYYVKISKKSEKGELNSQIVYTKAIDYDKINDVLMVRNRRRTDTISINKNGGSKKLKDFFIDEKIPRQSRQKIPLIALGNEIVWVINHRNGEKYMADDTTKNILYIHLWEEKP